MTHYLHLNEEFFNLIKNGTKTIEMRLLDEKRKTYKVGDFLIFIHRNNENLQLKTKIVALHKFKNFNELYKNFNKVQLGYAPNEKASPKDMESFYPVNEQEQFGVVGIEIELVWNLLILQKRQNNLPFFFLCAIIKPKKRRFF